MTQYLLLIQNNETTPTTAEEWERFLAAATASGMFRGGSEIGDRMVLGNTRTAVPSAHLAGYMRFDADDRQKLLGLLQLHPVIVHGGSVELCELPRS
jgi:hypothetical protein